MPFMEMAIISFETAARIAELGNYHRVKSSRKEKIEGIKT